MSTWLLWLLDRQGDWELPALGLWEPWFCCPGGPLVQPPPGHTMDYYLAVKSNKILPLAATWMELQGIMLNGVSQRKINSECVKPKKYNKLVC